MVTRLTCGITRCHGYKPNTRYIPLPWLQEWHRVCAVAMLTRRRSDITCCHGYKTNIGYSLLPSLRTWTTVDTIVDVGHTGHIQEGPRWTVDGIVGTIGAVVTRCTHVSKCLRYWCSHRGCQGTVMTYTEDMKLYNHEKLIQRNFSTYHNWLRKNLWLIDLDFTNFHQNAEGLEISWTCSMISWYFITSSLIGWGFRYLVIDWLRI